MFFAKRIRHLLVMVLLAVAFYAQAQEHHASRGRLEKRASEVDYNSWMQPFREMPLLADSVGVPPDVGHTNPAFLNITAVEGDDLPVDKRTGEILGRSYRIVYRGCSVSMEGRISSFQHDSGGFKGGGFPLLSPSDFSELKRLAANLPDDYSRLPPPGRRLVVQVAAPAIARVYDRANMPDELLDILQLIAPGIRPWILRINPEPAIATDGTPIPPPRIPLRPAMSPDGSLGVLQGDFRVRIIDGHTSSSLRELSEPDVGRQIIRLSDPYFTPDGRYLILRSSFPGLRIFDTKTWQQVPSPPEVPPDALAFFPSADWLHAIVLSQTGLVELWSPGAKAAIATLTKNEDILSVSYSPDQSLVAVATLSVNKKDRGPIRVRIWSSSDGSLKSELRPSDIQATALGTFGEYSHMLDWWPNGEYLFSAVRSNDFSSSSTLAVWNVNSGRYRAVLEGCPTMIDRFALDFETEQIVVECYAGNVLTFNATAALEKVKDFEQSLVAQQ